MYSDILNNKIVKRISKALHIKNRSIYLKYFKGIEGNLLFISIDFEYADDGHIEILSENLEKLQKVLNTMTKSKDLKSQLKDYFTNNTVRGSEYDSMIELLKDNGIEFKAIIFY